jgi:5-methylcytosine-specific restriction endonuclease McrA
MRTCTKCGIEKPTGDFYTNLSQCKSCKSQQGKETYQRHKKAIRERHKAYYQEHKYWFKEYQKKWHKANYEKRRESALARARSSRQEYPEILRERYRVWAKNNPDKTTANNHRRRARLTGVGGTYTAQEWVDLCDWYDNRCLSCGETTTLTVDHVVPIAKGGTNSIDNIQPLCGSCNSRKGAKEIDYREREIDEKTKHCTV